MLKNHRSLVFAAFLLLSVSSIFSQNRFEGYNLLLDVPDNQKVGTCALRYVAPPNGITITDLDRSTPMRVSACDQTTRLTQTGASAAMFARETDRKWCFTGEDKRYRITFPGDQTSGQITYDWIAAPAEKTGIYNIKDFGAVGDGKSDDTIAFKSAMAFIASRNGGTLRIPEGDFVITSPVALTSGLKIQGISAITTLAPTNNQVRANPSRIKLRGTNRQMFLIGECTEDISMHDLELFGESDDRTTGIEARGAYLSSQNFHFERVVFQGFNRGFYAHGLPINSYQWQFEAVRFSHCRFVYNRDVGIYSRVINSEWKIDGCMFVNPKRTATARADSMRFDQGGNVLVQHTFGGGFLGADGGTFLDVLNNANLTITNSQTEQMTASIEYNGNVVPEAGDYSYPMTLVNNIFGAPIIFKARRTFISTGNLYGAKTFQADERLRVYSTGDRFCYDGYTLGCEAMLPGGNRFDRATVIFMTGQPDEGKVKGHPTVFGGTDVLFGTPPQMPNFPHNALPAGKPNGSMIYCSNCRRNTTPCQAGGAGAPAMMVGGQWSCL